MEILRFSSFDVIRVCSFDNTNGVIKTAPSSIKLNSETFIESLFKNPENGFSASKDFIG